MSSKKSESTTCKVCVMRSKDDPSLVFNRQGVCGYCLLAKSLEQQRFIDAQNLPWYINEIKKRGRCIIGLSGGVDSSYALHVLKQHDVDVSAWHFDNGWNTPVADENVMKLVEGMKVPFYRYKIDRDKFNKLYKAFIEGGIKNLEAITDHLLFAINYEMAVKEGVKTIITGGNWQTESIMPEVFGEDPRDLYWIKSVYKRVTGKRLVGLPVIPLWKEQYYRLIKGIKFYPVLDYVRYNRQEAIERLGELYGYQDPGAKHEESQLTKWYQNEYLFYKYGLDKRRPHYSSMIHSGQMTREEALAKLKNGPQRAGNPLEVSWLYSPIKSYEDYPNSQKVRKLVMKAYAAFRK